MPPETPTKTPTKSPAGKSSRKSTKTPVKTPVKMPKLPRKHTPKKKIQDPLLNEACKFDASETVSAQASKLMHMPPKRTVELRTGIAKPVLSRIANREAVLAQAVGEVEISPCNHCKVGVGVFTDCVRVQDGDKHFLRGSCASCHANSLGKRCSFRRMLYQRRFYSCKLILCYYSQGFIAQTSCRRERFFFFFFSSPKESENVKD
jgi:hypothetical protein